jgi:phage terminase large subunit-like protein
MQRLKAKGVQTFEFTQNNMRMKADGHLRQLLQQKKYTHPAHDMLTEHVLNATLKYTNDQFRLIKGSKTSKIDLAVALSMAAYTLKELPAQFMSDFKPVVASNMQLPATGIPSTGYKLLENNRYGTN